MKIVVRRPVGLALAAAVLTLLGCGTDRSSSATVPAIVVEPLEQQRAPVRTVIRSGDTIESLSRRLAGGDWVAWRDALAGELDPRRLVPGVELRGLSSPSGRLECVEVVLDRRRELHFTSGPDGISAIRIERALESEVMRIEGEVTS
jgi:hypothetical protein